ncbi:DegT/DnrJ/EryC1/StrS aminotransferase family protein [Salinibacterium sp. M195]|uniref:DegT/DnrJ/EryC1/StrS family aminotransferase n=1 Tax=Salinibacterium sp. M195 TaxID=2583374 RepID=UPI001C62A025|nr:DegT/DnrJ/EryC1/StrS family aminotransferase [Salinibacterium sp. M195]QYH36006.1 DegT/DnrJ/EryC1/StrS family aminotransferase [Salinibacterium sp. M195]
MTHIEDPALIESPDRPVVPMNDLSRAISRDRVALSGALANVLDSGHVVMGPNHDAFQQELGAYLNLDHVLGVASGTDALELAIKAVMPKGRNVVVTAANAGGYTSTAALRAGFVVRYADVDSDSLCLSATSVQSSLTADVGVLVVTHLYGNLTDITTLVEMCHASGIRVVEDCAQAIGARRNGRVAGSFGDIAATSFYPTKNLGAIGDGGAVLTNNQKHADTVKQLRQYGWSSKYQAELPGGMNSRLDELQAAFLRSRIPQLDGLNGRRRAIIARYTEASAGGPLQVMPAVGEHHVGHLAVARSSRRTELRAALVRQGVQTDIHFPYPDYKQPGFRPVSQSLPVTELASSEIFSLPCFPELTEGEVDRVCNAIGTLI